MLLKGIKTCELPSTQMIMLRNSNTRFWILEKHSQGKKKIDFNRKGFKFGAGEGNVYCRVGFQGILFN